MNHAFLRINEGDAFVWFGLFPKQETRKIIVFFRFFYTARGADASSTPLSKKKRPIIRRLKRKFRLSLLKEASYEELFSILLTPLNVILLLAGFVLVVGIFSYSITALTPLREYIVPGYVDDQHRRDAYRARVVVDSLKAELETQERYLETLRTILTGGVPSDSLRALQNEQSSRNLIFSLSAEDSLLRARVEEEDRFMLRVGPSGQVETRTARGLLFKPVEGSMSSGFDADNNHFGIDLVAPANSTIRAAAVGTVILSSFTAEGGHVIAIQHENNLITVYKHNSALLKSVGERVKAGETIAIIGNTGDHSDGPHLHFEIWKNGVAVNPLEYLILGE